MKKQLVFITAAFLLLISCGTSSNQQEECTTDECLLQQAYDNVIAVHDEVMPKLSYISELKAKVEAKMTEASDSVKVNTYVQLMQDLDAADQSMWVWMRAFNSDIETMPFAEAMTYLKEEQAKVDEVARKINASIKAAEEATAE